jgi:hypothetical protein
MNTNDILKRFLGEQEARIKADVSRQGYKSDSPYVNSKQNLIQGTDQGTPITMKGVDFPVHGVDEYGNEQHMYPGEEYHFPGSQVKETRMEMAQYGKSVSFGTPEYESAYKAGQVQGKGFKPDDPNATWFGGELDEIAIKPKHSILSLNRSDYEKANGEEAFMNEKKDAYLKGLGSNWYGTSRTNFPKNVEKEIAQEYQYNKNNYGLEQLASSKGFDINKRGAWIEGLSAQERNAMVNSKYSSSLNPNEFAEALSGLQQAANTLLPGQPFDYQIPGLTPNENQEDKDSWASGFKMFAPMNIPGNYIANAAKNTNLSSHPNFRETPAMGMQRMGNVSSMESMALNPLSYEAIASVPDLAIGAYKGAKNLPETLRAAKHALLNNDVSKTFEKIDGLAYNGQTNIDLPKRNVADYADGAAFAESTKLAPYEPLVNLEGLPADYTKKQLAAYMKEAERHKLKYCKDGDEACAKSANAITQAIWNKLETGTNYDYNSNAADAWYSKDQITKHGGETIYDHTTDVGAIPLDKLQIGDQVMMGPKYGTSHAKFDPATGLAKEQGVQHRAVVVGINNGQPMILESGYGASLQPRPLDKNLFYSHTSGNGVTSVVRPKQFVNAKNDIANHILRSSEISRDATIEFGTSPAAQKYTAFFDKNKVEMANTLGLTQDELIQVYRSTIGIGAQETKLGNSISSGLLNQSKITIQNMLQKAGLTPLIKGSTNAIKGLANKAFDKKSADLLDFPGSAVVEMEAHKLVSSGAFSDVRSAVNNLYETKYNKASRFTTNSTAASKGIFRQKEISQSGSKMGLRQNNFADKPEKQLTSAVSNLSDILKKIRKENPEYSFEKALDLAKLSWNSPAKAKNKDLIDFFYDGVGNPDPSTIGFDYLGKVNKRMQELVPITGIKPNTSPGTLGFRLKEGGAITDQHRTILSKFLPKAQTGGIPRRPYDPSMDQEWNESYKPFGEFAQEAMDVVQHLIPATRSLPSVGSGIGIAQSMYNNEDVNMSDMVGLIPHPYAQMASLGLLGIEKSAENFKNYRVQSQSGKSIEQILFEKQASNYDSRTAIDSTAVAMPRMNSRLASNPLSSPEFIGKNNNSILNKQKPATKPKFESEFKPAPEKETSPVAKKPSAPRQPMEILKELHAKGMVMKQNAQITTSMGEIPYAPKAQYGVDMSGKATSGIDPRMAAALKNNTDHAQLLRNMQTSNESQTYYQGELDNVVVQQKTPHKGFWSQYGDRLREEHKDDGLLGAVAGLPFDAVAGFPQAAMMYGLSGKAQRPSEAMRMNGVEAAFADGVIDPTNLAGAGMMTKAGQKFARNAQGIAKITAAESGNLMKQVRETVALGSDIFKSNTSFQMPHFNNQKKIYEDLSNGARTLDDTMRSRLQDVKTAEGQRRVVKQERGYLESIGFPAKKLDEQALINYNTRVRELEHTVEFGNKNANLVNSHDPAAFGTYKNGAMNEPAAIFSQDRFAKDIPEFNAHFKGNATNVELDYFKKDEPKTFVQRLMDEVNNPNAINLKKKSAVIGGVDNPGEITLGFGYGKDAGTANHEVGHLFQNSRRLPIDESLRAQLNPLDDLASKRNLQGDYDYFLKGTKNRRTEPSAFLNEARQAMQEAGFIKNIYDPITEEVMEKAVRYFQNNPKQQLRFNEGRLQRSSNTRIFEFSKPTKENFKVLTDHMNDLTSNELTTPAGRWLDNLA